METMYHIQLVFQYLFVFELLVYSCYVFLHGYYCTAVTEFNIVSYCAMHTLSGTLYCSAIPR